MKNLLFLILMSMPILSIGQLFPPSSVDVSLQANVDSTFNLDPTMLDSAVLSTISHNIEVVVGLSDTTLVSSVHVKLIDNTTNTILFDGTIPFSQTNTTTSTYTIVRENKVLYIDFGAYTGSINFYAEAYTEDSQGGISSIVSN